MALFNNTSESSLPPPHPMDDMSVDCYLSNYPPTQKEIPPPDPLEIRDGLYIPPEETRNSNNQLSVEEVMGWALSDDQNDSEDDMDDNVFDMDFDDVDFPPPPKHESEFPPLCSRHLNPPHFDTEYYHRYVPPVAYTPSYSEVMTRGEPHKQAHQEDSAPFQFIDPSNLQLNHGGNADYTNASKLNSLNDEIPLCMDDLDVEMGLDVRDFVDDVYPIMDEPSQAQPANQLANPASKQPANQLMMNQSLKPVQSPVTRIPMNPMHSMPPNNGTSMSSLHSTRAAAPSHTLGSIHAPNTGHVPLNNSNHNAPSHAPPAFTSNYIPQPATPVHSATRAAATNNAVSTNAAGAHQNSDRNPGFGSMNPESMLSVPASSSDTVRYSLSPRLSGMRTPPPDSQPRKPNEKGDNIPVSPAVMASPSVASPPPLASPSGSRTAGSASPSAEKRRKAPRRRAARSGSAMSSTTHVCKLTFSDGSECRRSFTRPYDLARHQETIHAPVRKMYYCEHCGDDSKTFSRLDALSRHKRLKHAR